MEAAACTELDLDVAACTDFIPILGVLVCSPKVICGQWLCGQAIDVDGAYRPVLCSSLDLVPLVCLEA